MTEVPVLHLTPRWSETIMVDPRREPLCVIRRGPDGQLSGTLSLPTNRAHPLTLSLPCRVGDPDADFDARGRCLAIRRWGLRRLGPGVWQVIPSIVTQAQVMIAMRTIAPQDLAAMDAWIEVHGTPEQRTKLMESLPSLPRGDAWVWSPGWPTDEGIFQRVHVAPIETFDSGATPKPGEKRIEPKQRADVDLEALRRQMAATVERAKATDPKLLQRRVAELERELAKKPAPAAPAKVETKVVEKPVVKDAQIKRLEVLVQKGLDLNVKMKETADRISEWINANANAFQFAAAELAKVVGATIMNPTPHGLRPAPAPPRPVPYPRSGSAIEQARPRGTASFSTRKEEAGDLGKGERKVLAAIAQHDGGVTREQLTVLTGYKRSSRDTHLQRLRSAGFVEDGERITVTDAGVAELGPDFEPLPTGAALLEYHRQRLPEGERVILDVVVSAYPEAIDREAISEATEYQRSSRDTHLQRLRSRRLVLDAGRGLVRASDTLFDER